MRNSWVGAVLGACFWLLPVLPADAQSPGGNPVVAVPSQPSVGTGVAPWMEGWTGFGFSNNFYGGWVGVVAALNETHNVWIDGYVLRVEGIAGHYDYPTTNVPSGRANVFLDGAGLLFGYRKKLGDTLLTGYLGVNYENDQNPDPTAAVRGTEAGVKILGEIYSRLSPIQDFYGQAFFSTAFDKWYVLARPGFLVTRILWIGPEGQVFGNKGSFGASPYEEGRIGAFAHIVLPNQPLFGDWIVSGGYRAPLVHGSPSGYYAQIGLNFQFR